ncbi:LOW QUALITY PROTEIN: protein phosphatase 1 regulatory subunit 16A [Mixophyes fleayi]|uniref:LOW QUALITY PROTEIN: protein phosphatase 1 regulatory subunit 16A n=1 Tax=Mixophyes fleayi TaxID=3061075 RepID=UPI003F4E2C62
MKKDRAADYADARDVITSHRKRWKRWEGGEAPVTAERSRMHRGQEEVGSCQSSTSRSAGPALNIHPACTRSVRSLPSADVCGDEEVRAKLLELKHKHDAIKKSQDKHKSALQRRTSSAGSRGKVVRRVSVTERTNMYRREHQKEAMVWQQRGSRESEAELQDEDEDKTTNAEMEPVTEPEIQRPENETGETQSPPVTVDPPSSLPLSQKNGSVKAAPKHTFSKRLDRSVSYQLATQAELCPDLNHERSHHTLAELKRQRAAAKLQRHAPPPPILEPPVQTPDSAEPASPNSVYYTSASGEPPLLKLIAPAEDTTPAGKRPCCGVM